MSFSAGFIGTTEGKSRSFGAVSAGWRTPACSAMPAQYFSFRKIWLMLLVCHFSLPAINQALCEKDTFLITLRDNIATVLNRENNQALADIDKRLEELQIELLKLATSNADYDKVGDEIFRLRDEKQKIQLDCTNKDEQIQRMEDMSTFLKNQPTQITEFNEQLVRRLVEKVTIYEDKFAVEFKSGVTVNVIE